MLTALEPQGKSEWEFDYPVRSGMPSLFNDFYCKFVCSTGEHENCPSTRAQAYALWSSAIAKWRERFLNPPPQEAIEAYLSITRNGQMRICTQKHFHTHPGWKEEYFHEFKEPTDNVSERARWECKYFAWKVARSYAKLKGKSDAEAADAGRRSMDAANTETEYRLYRTKEPEKESKDDANNEKRNNAQWVANIHRRLDEWDATAAASGDDVGGSGGSGCAVGWGWGRRRRRR